MDDKIRDLEQRFNIGGRVHVAQVCSPNPHSAAPVSDSRGEWETAIYTCAADDLADFDHDDPDFLAQRAVVDISTRLPNVPEAELAAFYDKVVAWICEHRRVAATTRRCAMPTEGMFMELIRKRFADAGFPISPRVDVDAAAAAWFLGKSKKTLDNWRWEKRGPAYVNLGRDIRYPLAAILEFLEASVRMSG